MAKNINTNDESLQIKFAVLSEKFDNQTIALQEVKRDLESNYTRDDRFVPVRNLVYGLVFLILTAVIGAILNFVIILPHK